MELTSSAKTPLKAAAALLFLVWGGLLNAQSGGIPEQLGTEIQKLEQTLSAGASRAERHDTLARLARLRQLSGNLAGAAANWLDAAEADARDAVSLIAGAYCLAALGEWEKAESVLKPLLASAMQGPSMLQARYLDAFLKARNSSNASILAALAGDSEFALLHPAIYYSLWQIISGNPGMSEAGSAESWKTRLIDEFPKSPEARIATGKTNSAPAITAVQSPLWLLFPETVNSKPIELPQPAVPIKPATTANPSFSPGPGNEKTASGVALQTGLFGKETNARTQSETLQKAGFTASVSRKQVNGADHWVVTVPAGQNVDQTIAELKKAGFESFPVK